MDTDKLIKKPDYMDRFTGIESDKYSNMNLDCSLSFTDESGKVYKGRNFKVPAAVKGTFTIGIRNKGKAMKAGSVISCYVYNGAFAHEMQKSNPLGKDYVSVESSGNAKFRLFERIPGFSRVCRLYLEKGRFRKNDSVEIRIGDMRKGSTGSNTYWTAGTSYFFVEAGDENEMLPVRGMPIEFEVIARNDRSFMRILAPTVAKAGDAQRIHIGVFDNCGNLFGDMSGIVILNGKELEIENGSGIIEEVVFNKPGTYRLEGQLKYGGEVYYSNPITVHENPGKYIYWGDLHAHGWGDSTMHLMHVSNEKISPLSRHLQARDIGRFDFSASGPMSYPKIDRNEIWNAYKEACQKTDESGKYIPFLSYEAHPIPVGDRNIFFKDVDEDIPPDFRLPMSELEETYGFRNDVMLEVHIGGRIPGWGDYLPVRERMLEAISAFGNAEWLLQEALDRGFRPAVCGSSDLHYGLMGGPRTIEESRGRFHRYLNKRDSAYGTGPVTAVLAPELTRDALWNAFEQRHTYATTDRRIHIGFTVNGSNYGDEIPESDEYNVEVDIKGTDEIQRIYLVSGKYTVKEYNPDTIDFSDKFVLESGELKGGFLYLKVLQKDGGFAITSPVYINFDKPGWRTGDIYSDDREKAATFKPDLVRYLKTEEDITRFSRIEPVGIIDEKITKCALFHAMFGEREISIRWYYEYEIPRFRMDWGRTNIGIMNDEIIHRI